MFSGTHLGDSANSNNMKKTSCILIFVLSSVFLHTLFSQSISFEKVYGPGCDGFYCVRQTFDGGYISTGVTNGDTACAGNYNDIYLVKTDPYGDTLWAKNIGNPLSSDQGFFVEQTSDSGYIIAGMNNGWGDVYLVKTDINGNVLWSKTYGGAYWDAGGCVRELKNGGYILTGNKGTSSSTSTIYLIKTDQNGNLNWSKNYVNGYGLSTGAGSLLETFDYGYVLTGQIDTINIPKAFLMKTDSAGIVSWLKIYNQGAETYGASVAQCSDSGFVMFGSKHNAVGRDFFIVRTDLNGDTIWKKTIDRATHDMAGEIQQTSDGGFIITGGSGWIQCCADSMDLYVAKLNSNGQIQWSKIFGTPTQYDFGTYVEQTNDGGYVIAGATSSFGAPSSYGYLIKLDSSGTVTGIENSIINEESFNIYPNPANSTLTVILNKKNSIVIVNLLGEVVMQKNFPFNKKENLELDVSLLSSGIYFIKVGNEVTKFVKQ